MRVIGNKTLKYWLTKGWEDAPKVKMISFEGNKHIAIDNTTSEFFMEEFDTLHQALEYLNLKGVE